MGAANSEVDVVKKEGALEPSALAEIEDLDAEQIEEYGEMLDDLGTNAVRRFVSNFITL